MDPAQSDSTIQQADALFFEADTAIESGRIPQAMEILNDLLARWPKYGRAWNHLGFIYETRIKDFQKAEECYKKSLAFSPDYSAVYLNYIVLLSIQERWDELNELLDSALKVPGIHKARVMNEYGIMYEAQGLLDQAIEYYNSAIHASFDENDITRFRASIERCKNKLNSN